MAAEFEATKQGDDISLLLISRILRLPNGLGLILNFVFGKVLRSGITHSFGLSWGPDKKDPWACACQLLEEYVAFAKSMGLEVLKGYLYFEVDYQMNKIPGRLDPSIMTLNLKKYMKLTNLDLGQGLPVSMQSFRSRGAISKILNFDRKPLQKVMYDACWSNHKTAWRYMKILEVLVPFQPDSST